MNGSDAEVTERHWATQFSYTCVEYYPPTLPTVSQLNASERTTSRSGTFSAAPSKNVIVAFQDRRCSRIRAGSRQGGAHRGYGSSILPRPSLVKITDFILNNKRWNDHPTWGRATY